jgi:transposase InsO family protein
MVHRGPSSEKWAPVHAGRSFSASAVRAALDAAMARYGKPAFIRSDNGPEFIATLVRKHLRKCGIDTLYIPPGSPWENPFVESFHGKLRDECLDRELFSHLLEARVVLNDYRDEYNHRRPHSGLKYAVPAAIFTRSSGAGELFTAASSTPTS